MVDDIGIKSVSRPGVGTTRKAESDDLKGDSLAARRAEKAGAEGDSRERSFRSEAVSARSSTGSARSPSRSAAASTA